MRYIGGWQEFLAGVVLAIGAFTALMAAAFVYFFYVDGVLYSNGF